MKILIVGAGKMGSFFCDLLSFDQDVAIYDPAPGVYIRLQGDQAGKVLIR